jgi:Flp pilus assembly protein TadG
MILALRLALACRARVGVRNVAQDCRGASAVEAAIALPILLVLIVGVIEVGFMLWTQVSLNFAVEQAARCGALNFGVNNATICKTAATIQSFAVAQAVGIPGLTTANFTVHTSGAAVCGSGTQVAASYNFQSMVQSLVPYTLTISATSCYPT